MHEYSFDGWQDLFNKLKPRLYPCPFCGAAKGDLMFDWVDDQHLAVYCCNCDARGPEVKTTAYDSFFIGDEEGLAKDIVQDTIIQWNKRYTYNQQ